MAKLKGVTSAGSMMNSDPSIQVEPLSWRYPAPPWPHVPRVRTCVRAHMRAPRPYASAPGTRAFVRASESACACSCGFLMAVKQHPDGEGEEGYEAVSAGSKVPPVLHEWPGVEPWTP